MRIQTSKLLAPTLYGLMALMASSGVQAANEPQVNNLVRDLSQLDWVRYGDAESYSLAIGDWWYQHATGENKSPYRVPISDANKGIFAIANESTRTAPGMENPYEALTQTQGVTWSITDVQTYNGIDGTINNNTGDATVSTAWDITLAALNTYLTVDSNTYEPVLYFQNNQTNSNDSFNQSLAAWARAWVTDPTGATIGSYLFSNASLVDPLDPSQGTIGNPYALVTEGGGGLFKGDVTEWSSDDLEPNGEIPADPNATPPTPRLTDFVLSGGDICVAYGDYAGGDGGLDPTTNLNALRPIPVACGTTVAELAGLGIDPLYNAVSTPIVHNLGNDSFPYAIRFPELNALIAGLNQDLLDQTISSLDAYTLHVDIRLGCGVNEEDGSWDFSSGAFGDTCLVESLANPWNNALYNGPESAVIGAMTAGDVPPPPRIPEPGILALLGLGLAGLGFARRRNKV